MIQPYSAFTYISVFCFSLLFSNTLIASEKQLVLGAGPSTAIVTLFFENFSNTIGSHKYIFEVEQRSIKHAGGISASDKYLFGRTGRPLNDNEKALNKDEIFLARVPITMVIGEQAGVKDINLDQLKKIFMREITNWRQLGGKDHKIILIGREKSEAAFGVLKRSYNFFEHVAFDRIFNRDHQVVNFLQSKDGAYAISFGSSSNFKARYHLNVSGFKAAINLGLVYDKKNSMNPLVESVKTFSQSDTWMRILRESDFLPPDTY